MGIALWNSIQFPLHLGKLKSSRNLKNSSMFGFFSKKNITCQWARCWFFRGHRNVRFQKKGPTDLAVIPGNGCVKLGNDFRNHQFLGNVDLSRQMQGLVWCIVYLFKGHLPIGCWMGGNSLFVKQPVGFQDIYVNRSMGHCSYFWLSMWYYGGFLSHGTSMTWIMLRWAVLGHLHGCPLVI